MRKDVFMDVHKRPNVIKDYANFLKKIDKLNLFLIEFNEDGTIRSKVYLLNCIIKDKNSQPIIIITHDKYIFFANNRIQKVLA